MGCGGALNVGVDHRRNSVRQDSGTASKPHGVVGLGREKRRVAHRVRLMLSQNSASVGSARR